MRRAAAGALVPLVAGLVVGPLAPMGPARAESVDCMSTTTDTPGSSSTTDPSVPLDLLGIQRAHDWLAARDEEPGEGVRVAVVDSGVAPRAAGSAIPVVDGPVFSQKKNEVVYAHGTVVAGIIAGAPRPAEGGGEELPVGVAPAAEVVDVRVYDSEGGDGEDPVEPANLVSGLSWVADNAKRLGIGVVNVSLAVGEYEPLKKVLKRLAAADVVVVAASGNRPTEEGQFLFDRFGPDPEEGQGVEPGEDAAGLVWPAASSKVVAVSSTADGTDAGDATGFVLQSSDIDVAVPTAGLISYGLDGGSCGVSGIATSWATAVVSGVVAMLRGHFDDENAEQVVARLLATASASTDQPNVQTGAGTVQPLDALSRPLRPRKDGSLEAVDGTGDTVERATAPPEEVDLLADARDRAVWWGLIGGGALLLALVLRPVLARRRS